MQEPVLEATTQTQEVSGLGVAIQSLYIWQASLLVMIGLWGHAMYYMVPLIASGIIVLMARLYHKMMTVTTAYLLSALWALQTLRIFINGKLLPDFTPFIVPVAIVWNSIFLTRNSSLSDYNKASAHLIAILTTSLLLLFSSQILAVFLFLLAEVYLVIRLKTGMLVRLPLLLIFAVGLGMPATHKYRLMMLLRGAYSPAHISQLPTMAAPDWFLYIIPALFGILTVLDLNRRTKVAD